MTLHAYIELQSSESAELRKIEKSLFGKLIGLLEKAGEPDAQEVNRTVAIEFCERVWLTLIEDIVNKKNGLPLELKQKLGSIGLWMIKECTRAREDRESSLEVLTEVNQIVMAGLD